MTRQCCELDDQCPTCKPSAQRQAARFLAALESELTLLQMCRHEVISVVDEQYVAGWEAGLEWCIVLAQQVSQARTVAGPYV